MAKIYKVKEEIGAIKTYLGFIVAILIALGAGVSKLYLESHVGLLMYLGLLGISFFALLFSYLAKVMHDKIKRLGGL